GSALHVDHRAAAAADEVVVVVTELELGARGVTGRLEAPDEPGAGEGGEDVVDSLGAHRAEPLTGTPGDGLDIRVRMLRELTHDRDAGGGHAQRLPPQQRGRASGVEWCRHRHQNPTNT